MSLSILRSLTYPHTETELVTMLTEEWTVQRVLDEVGRDPRDKGYTAVICTNGSCLKTANILRRLPGWHCDCGRFNVIPSDARSSMHEGPDIGPPSKFILLARDKRHS